MYRKGADELAAARAELVSYGTRLLDDGLAAGSAGVVALSASRPELPAIHYAITALGRPWPTGSPQPRPQPAH